MNADPTSEVEFHNFEVRNNHGWLSSRLLVVVVPLATQALGLIPNFNQLFVILHHYCVLVELALGIWLCATTLNNSTPPTPLEFC